MRAVPSFWGEVFPNYVAAIGTVAAVVVALWLATRDRRVLVRHHRQAEAYLIRVEVQAGWVPREGSWSDAMGRETLGHHGFWWTVRNGSAATITQIKITGTVTSTAIQPSTQQLNLEVIPSIRPGDAKRLHYTCTGDAQSIGENGLTDTDPTIDWAVEFTDPGQFTWRVHLDHTVSLVSAPTGYGNKL